MQKNTLKSERTGARRQKQKITWKLIVKQRYLFLMSVPFIIWCFVFKYMPLWGWSMAFQKVRASTFSKGFFEREFVGLDNFRKIFSEPSFYRVLRNTLVTSLLGIILGFVFSIGFALLLNEIRSLKFKKLTQTISYLPHFVSWVIVASIVSIFLKDSGVVNEILMNIGIIKEPIPFQNAGKGFWLLITSINVWKETGWDAIIYLSAMAGIDQGLYEAAKVDGAGRFRRMWNITLPSIRPTIIVLLILTIGSVLNVGMERQMLISNPLTQDYAEVLDWYAFKYGIGNGNFSFGTAIGIFKSLISVILIFSANKLADKFGEGKLI